MEEKHMSVKCPKCGTKLDVEKDRKQVFCFNCGTKIKIESKKKFNNKNISQLHNVTIPTENNGVIANKDFTDRIKNKITTLWNEEDLFSKISIVTFFIAVLLLFISIGNRKVFPVVFSVIQILSVIIAILIHKGFVKLHEKQRLIEILAIVISFASVIFNVMSYSWNITSNKNSLEVVTPYMENDNNEINEDEISVPESALDYKYKKYIDVQSSLENAGFENISFETLYDIVLGWTDEGEVESVSINNLTDFKRGDIFKKDSEIIITYHMKAVDDPNKTTAEENNLNDSETGNTSKTDISDLPEFYSTNTSATVRNGNSGIYAYRSKGGIYDMYWIIDFDEGNVYYFTDGNSYEECDRLKIDSGDLNTVVMITYHDEEDTWQYGLHFKYVNNPEHLIMQDNDGFEYDYYTTNLNSALSIRDEKIIKDY